MLQSRNLRYFNTFAKRGQIGWKNRPFSLPHIIVWGLGQLQGLWSTVAAQAAGRQAWKPSQCAWAAVTKRSPWDATPTGDHRFLRESCPAEEIGPEDRLCR